MVPGWIVNVALFATWMKPLSVYTVSAYSVRFAVMSVVMSVAAFPKARVVVDDSPDAVLLAPPFTVMTW